MKTVYRASPSGAVTPPAALGIDKINIATQAGAAAAVNTIKTAINNVSSIRRS